MKHLHLVSAPDNGPDWPVWPGYVALWSVGRITTELEALITYRGHEAKTVIDFGEVVKLVTHIVGEYDQALSKAQFDLWALEGMRTPLNS